MNSEPSIPQRFLAHSVPGEGVVQITDQNTGNSGSVRLACYQSVATLLSALFDGEHGQAPATIQDIAPVSGDTEPKKRGRGRPKKTEVAKSTEAQEELALSDATSTSEAKVAEVAETQVAEIAKEPETPTITNAPDHPELSKPKKRGRPKMTEEQKAAAKAAREAAKKPSEEPKAPAEPKVEAKAAAPAKAKASAKSKSTKGTNFTPSKPLEAEIQDAGFKLVLSEENPENTYDIILDDGDKVFGTVQFEGEKKISVKPADGENFSATSHSSLMAAQSRICILI